MYICIYIYMARRNELKILGGLPILSAMMVGLRRIFFISNPLTRLENLNIFRRKIM